MQLQTGAIDAERSLSVVTFNIEQTSCFSSPDIRPQIVSAVGPLTPDLLALQQDSIDSPECNAKQLSEIGEELNLLHSTTFDSLLPEGSTRSTAVSLISRWPILEEKVHTYTPYWGCFAQEAVSVAAAARVRPDGWARDIWLVCTVLASYCLCEQSQQAAELEAFITEELETTDAEAVLLCADLGTCKCCPSVQRLSSLSWDIGGRSEMVDVTPVSRYCGCNGCCGSATRKSCCCSIWALDYIMYAGGLLLREATVGHSNSRFHHYPVHADFVSKAPRSAMGPTPVEELLEPVVESAPEEEEVPLFYYQAVPTRHGTKLFYHKTPMESAGTVQGPSNSLCVIAVGSDASSVPLVTVYKNTRYIKCSSGCGWLPLTGLGGKPELLRYLGPVKNVIGQYGGVRVYKPPSSEEQAKAASSMSPSVRSPGGKPKTPRNRVAKSEATSSTHVDRNRQVNTTELGNRFVVVEIDESDPLQCPLPKQPAMRCNVEDGVVEERKTYFQPVNGVTVCYHSSPQDVATSIAGPSGSFCVVAVGDVNEATHYTGESEGRRFIKCSTGAGWLPLTDDGGNASLRELGDVQVAIRKYGKVREFSPGEASQEAMSRNREKEAKTPRKQECTSPDEAGGVSELIAITLQSANQPPNDEQARSASSMSPSPPASSPGGKPKTPRNRGAKSDRSKEERVAYRRRLQGAQVLLQLRIRKLRSQMVHRWRSHSVELSQH